MYTRILAVLLSVSLLSAPALAVASPWNQTFGSTGGQVAPASERVIVVAAGEPSESLSAAAAALVEASRGSAKMVMDGGALGDVSALDDAAIVAKAQHLPVERIAVVRVFPGADGDTAVVTVYDKKDTVVASFAGTAGEAIVADADAGTGSGVSAGAAAAIGALAVGRSQSRAEAEEEYERTYVWFEDWVAMQAQTGQVVGNWSVPYQGKYKKELSGGEFYDVVGRADLASSYRTRAAWKTGLMLGGYGAVLGGTAYFVYGAISGIGSCEYDDPNYDRCEKDASDSASSKMVVGGVIAGTGLVLGLIGGVINPHPVEMTEARRLADDYNKGLKKELGLASKAPALELEPGLVMLNGGGGLGLSGTFR